MQEFDECKLFLNLVLITKVTKNLSSQLLNYETNGSNNSIASLENVLYVF